MLLRSYAVSLALPLSFYAAVALDLDVNSLDSIKSTAKTIASAIVGSYNDNLEEERVPGLFEEPYYWWEAGAVWESLLEYSHLTGDSQFNDLISTGILHQVGDYDAFMPPNQTKTLGNADQATWGLAAMTAAEIGFPEPSGETKWVDLAVNVFNTQAARWDEESCGGGLKWQIFTFNNGYNYKNTWSNAGFFLLSARLALFTKNETYSQWAEEAYQWMQDVGLISDFHAFDGTDDRANCSQINHIQWTCNHAMLTEGAALLYNLTSGDNTWKDAVTGFVNASSVFQNDTILSEVACENNGKCDVDQKAFKGVAVRSFARAAIAAPFASESINTMLQASAKGAAANCDGDGNDLTCGLRWTGENDDADSVDDGGLGEAFSAMAAVQALLWPQAEPVESGNSTSPSPSASGTGSPSGTGGAAGPENTNAAGMTVASWGTAFLGAVFAVLLL